jgi:hypothetical protein
MNNDEYLALETDVFTAPENPGATPEIVNKATAAQIMEANRAQKEATRVYRTYNNVNQHSRKSSYMHSRTSSLMRFLMK